MRRRAGAFSAVTRDLSLGEAQLHSPIHRRRYLDSKVVYRRYASLYFIIGLDEDEENEDEDSGEDSGDDQENQIPNAR